MKKTILIGLSILSLSSCTSLLVGAAAGAVGGFTAITLQQNIKTTRDGNKTSWTTDETSSTTRGIIEIK